MNTLQLRYDVHDDQLTSRPVVDGHDLLRGYRNELGLDPDMILPPLSATLLPTRAGHDAVLGRCTCGETGCGSLSVRIARAGSQVVWAPVAQPPSETIDRTYRFELQPYLDVVDDAAEHRPTQEGRGRHATRAVRLALGLCDQAIEPGFTGGPNRVDWINAWPWTGDTVTAAIIRDGGQHVHEIEARHGEGPDEFAARVLQTVQRELYRRP